MPGRVRGVANQVSLRRCLLLSRFLLLCRHVTSRLSSPSHITFLPGFSAFLFLFPPLLCPLKSPPFSRPSFLSLLTVSTTFSLFLCTLIPWWDTSVLFTCHSFGHSPRSLTCKSTSSLTRRRLQFHPLGTLSFCHLPSRHFSGVHLFGCLICLGRSATRVLEIKRYVPRPKVNGVHFIRRGCPRRCYSTLFTLSTCLLQIPTIPPLCNSFFRTKSFTDRHSQLLTK